MQSQCVSLLLKNIQWLLFALRKRFSSLTRPKDHMCFDLCIATQPHLEPLLPRLFPLKLPHRLVCSFKVLNSLLQSPLIDIILISDERSLP